MVDGAALWRDFEPPLVALVRAGKTERALELLASGEAERTAPLDTPLRGGATLLHLAAAANSDELMRALFSAGAEVRASQDCAHSNTPGGRTPLHAAAACGAVTTAATLLEVAGESQALTTDWEGRTPAEVAWAAGHHSLALLLREAARRAVESTGGDGLPAQGPQASAAEVAAGDVATWGCGLS